MRIAQLSSNFEQFRWIYVIAAIMATSALAISPTTVLAQEGCHWECSDCTLNPDGTADCETCDQVCEN